MGNIREELVGPYEERCAMAELITKENHHVWWPREKRGSHSFIHSGSTARTADPRPAHLHSHPPPPFTSA